MVDPKAEARERVGGRYDVRVLEPSPPSVDEPPWFADDAVVDGRGDVGDLPVVAPVPGRGDVTWDEVCAKEGDPELSAWCADRWLGAWRRLRPLPPAFAPTRDSLHALAEHVLCRARHVVTGRIGLRFTRHGFGTPFYGGDQQVRVADGAIVLPDGRRHVVMTLDDAAALVGCQPGVPAGVYPAATDGAPGRHLPIDTAAARVLGDWYGFCASVLEQLRVACAEPSRVQLWPEHFDMAFDTGVGGGRTNFGGSPGDRFVPEPYLYVGPWDVDGLDRGDRFWNAPFGAVLPYEALFAADDQRGAASAFFAEGAARLKR